MLPSNSTRVAGRALTAAVMGCLLMPHRNAHAEPYLGPPDPDPTYMVASAPPPDSLDAGSSAGPALITTGLSILLTAYIPTAVTGAVAAAESGAGEIAVNAIPIAGPFVAIGMIQGDCDSDSRGFCSTLSAIELTSGMFQVTGLALTIAGAVVDGNANETAAAKASPVPSVAVGPTSARAMWIFD